jgi:hypothetical protein
MHLRRREACGPVAGGFASTPSAPTGSKTFVSTISMYAAASFAARFAGSSTNPSIIGRSTRKMEKL